MQPDGRPQLLDFPPGPAAGLTTAVGVLGQSATALLEGSAPARRPRGGAPPAPARRPAALGAPASAAPAIGSPAEFADELAATRGLAARVTRPIRGVQLAIQAGFLGARLGIHVAVAGLYSVISTSKRIRSR